MARKSDNEQCSTCKYAIAKDEPVLYCRRYPPTLLVTNIFNSPDTTTWHYTQVSDDDWCGEYASKVALDK